MSTYALELLNKSHDRKHFRSGLESIDRYLQETARGHTEKAVSLTRVLIPAEAQPPKSILGYFTLAPLSVEAYGWPDVPKGLPKNPVGAVLLGRMGVDVNHQGKGIATRLIALARLIAYDSLTATGGMGLVVDAAHDDLIPLYHKFGFRQVSPTAKRLFLPTASLMQGN